MLPLQSLIFLAGAYTDCKNAACHACSENAKGSLHRCVAQTSFRAGMQKKGLLHSRDPRGGDRSGSRNEFNIVIGIGVKRYIAKQ